MTFLNKLIASLQNIAEVGGPVVMTLMAVSLVTLAVVLYKIWQFSAAGVGRHKALTQAITAWDAGDRPGAKAALGKSTSYLAPVVALALDAEGRDDIAVASASFFGTLRTQMGARVQFSRMVRCGKRLKC